MKNKSAEEKIIRDYLLGVLSDTQEIRRIEIRIFLDDRYNELIAIAEENLIEEFLDAELTAAEREQFERHFLIDHDRQQEVQIIKGLRKLAVLMKLYPWA